MTEGHPLTEMPKKTEVKEVRPLTERGAVKDFDPIYQPSARDAGEDVFNIPKRPRESKADPSAIFSRGSVSNQMRGLWQQQQQTTVPANASTSTIRTDIAMAQVKEVIPFPSCVLYPPASTLNTPSQRERHPGSKTVFVSGLPDACTKEIVRQIFEKCGKIVAICMKKRNSCHIRFSSQNSVDDSICFSGYQVQIEAEENKTHVGTLNVIPSLSGADEREYECHQSEARHCARMEQLRLRSHTLPPVPRYSDLEATILGEKLQNSEHFMQSVRILIIWLDKGECSKSNAEKFYSMIQSTNSHVIRLTDEVEKSEDELNKAELHQKMTEIALQFKEIKTVFDAASFKKVSSCFNKIQRKNIDRWKRQADRVADWKDSTKNDSNAQEEVIKLKKDVCSLHNQLQVAQQKVVAMKKEGAIMKKNVLLLKKRNAYLHKQLDELRREKTVDSIHSERSSMGPMCHKKLSLQE